MNQAEHLDALVLGSGSGGNLLAWHLARSGQRVALVERRYIRVNERLETTAPDVCQHNRQSPSPQFTHVSVDDFRIIRDNLAGGARSTGDRLVPYCVFTDPPLAHIGLNERDARRQGIAVRIGKLPMTAVYRREATDETQGFMKVLVGANDDRILGFTMIGADAGEVMAAIQTAMLAGLPYPKLRDAVIAHMTTVEGLGFLLGNVPPRPIAPSSPHFNKSSTPQTPKATPSWTKTDRAKVGL